MNSLKGLLLRGQHNSDKFLWIQSNKNNILKEILKGLTLYKLDAIFFPTVLIYLKILRNFHKNKIRFLLLVKNTFL